jgi:hypothetical protein
MDEPKAWRGMPTGPVFIVHLEEPKGSGLAACCGRPFDAPRSRRGELLTLCTGCQNAGKPAEARAAVLRELRDEVEGMSRPEDITDDPEHDNVIWQRNDVLVRVLAAIDRRLADA